MAMLRYGIESTIRATIIFDGTFTNLLSDSIPCLRQTLPSGWFKVQGGVFLLYGDRNQYEKKVR